LRFYCKIFYASQFDALRRNCGFEEYYIESLSRCVKWTSRGGKSGAVFLKTKGKYMCVLPADTLLETHLNILIVVMLDDRLIIKQLQRAETDALLRFAPSYFEYMADAFSNKVTIIISDDLILLILLS
jgi:1-phosphatidylinositol-3-phosphate 5-kinase